MQAAHSRNVVHRDLKPANVLRTADSTPRITDFGLARHLHADSRETQAGTVMGTPSYMAPSKRAAMRTKRAYAIAAWPTPGRRRQRGIWPSCEVH